MPLYEYTCLDCSHSFDKLRPMAEADTSNLCPDCGSDHTSRSLSAIAAPQIGKDSPNLGTFSSGCACGGACGCGGH